jgi:hypothetical protein
MSMTKSEIVKDLRALADDGCLPISVQEDASRLAEAVEALPDATCPKSLEARVDAYLDKVLPDATPDLFDKMNPHRHALIHKQAKGRLSREEAAILATLRQAADENADRFIAPSLQMLRDRVKGTAAENAVAPPTEREREMWGLLETLAATMQCDFKIPCLGGASTLCPVCDAKDFVRKHRHEFEVTK